MEVGSKSSSGEDIVTYLFDIDCSLNAMIYPFCDAISVGEIALVCATCKHGNVMDNEHDEVYHVYVKSR